MQRVRKTQCDWDNCRLAARLQVLATSLALFSACIGTAICCVWLRLYSLGCEFNEARDCKNIRGSTKIATKSYKQLQQSKHLTELHAANPSTANTRKRGEDCSTNADRHGISQTVSECLVFSVSRSVHLVCPSLSGHAGGAQLACRLSGPKVLWTASLVLAPRLLWQCVFLRGFARLGRSPDEVVTTCSNQIDSAWSTDVHGLGLL